jgi:hypothetical protein
LERTVPSLTGSPKHTEVSYAITSLPAPAASPARLRELIRGD